MKLDAAVLQITEFPSGQKRTVKPDGTEIIEFGGGGGRQTNFPDGTVEVVQSGQTQTMYPSGKKVTEFDDGQRQTTWKDGRTKTLTPAGVQLVTWPDGAEITMTPNKHNRSALPDGTEVTEFVDGQTQITFPNGMQETILPNGTRQTLHSDGKKILTFPDGQRQTTWPDSTYETVLPDGQRQTSYPDGRKVVEWPDGQMQITHPDGSQETVWPAVTKQEETDGVIEEKDQNLAADVRVQSSRSLANETESAALQAHSRAIDDAVAAAASIVCRVSEDIEREAAAAAAARAAKTAAKEEAARQAAEAAAAAAKREEDRLVALATKEAAAKAETERAKKLSRLPSSVRPSPPQSVRLSGTGHTPRRICSGLEPLKREAEELAAWVQSWPPELKPLVSLPAAMAYMQRSGLNNLDDCYQMTQEHVDGLASKLTMQQPAIPLPLPQSNSDRTIPLSTHAQQSEDSQDDEAAPTAVATLQELWRRISAFQRWDTHQKGVVNYHDVDLAIHATFSREMVAMLLGKDNLQDKFDAIDVRKEGEIRFSDFFLQCSIDPKFFGLVKNEAVMQSQPRLILPQMQLLADLKVLKGPSHGISGSVPAPLPLEELELQLFDPATERWFERCGSLAQQRSPLDQPKKDADELSKSLQTCVIRQGATGDVYAVARVRRRDV